MDNQDEMSRQERCELLPKAVGSVQPRSGELEEILTAVSETVQPATLARRVFNTILHPGSKDKDLRGDLKIQDPLSISLPLTYPELVQTSSTANPGEHRIPPPSSLASTWRVYVA